MKRGFTLIELLAVIIIISVTSMIIFPNVVNVINDSKEDLYKTQVLELQKAAEKWSLNNKDRLDITHANDIFISVESLQDSGYLEKETIKNPKDKSVMNGCIRISYNLDVKKYSYIYEEKTCDSYKDDTVNDEAYGAIIYTYDTNSKTFLKDSDNEVKSASVAIQEIYENTIKTIGQTDDGLYDTGDEYVFRGANPNNYVTLTGHDGNTIKTTSFRILGIDKNTNNVRLITTQPIATNAWDSSKKINFKESSLNSLLLSKIDSDGNVFYTNKIVDYDYSIGIVKSGEFSIDALRSTLNDVNTVDNKSSQKIASISVLDYVNASASSCDLNYSSNVCATNNYLKNMFGNSNTIWTINTDGANIWFINNDGTLATAQSNSVKQIYAVVTLDSSAYISNLSTATGSSTNPFIIK